MTAAMRVAWMAVMRVAWMAVMRVAWMAATRVAWMAATRVACGQGKKQTNKLFNLIKINKSTANHAKATSVPR